MLILLPIGLMLFILNRMGMLPIPRLSMRYRIVTAREGYSIQRSRWWWPFWVTWTETTDCIDVLTFRTAADALAYVDRRQDSRRFRSQEVIRFTYIRRLP